MGFCEFDDPPIPQVKAQVADLDHHSSAREEAVFKSHPKNTTSQGHGLMRGLIHNISFFPR